jgi:hypothetical protein
MCRNQLRINLGGWKHRWSSLIRQCQKMPGESEKGCGRVKVSIVGTREFKAIKHFSIIME